MDLFGHVNNVSYFKYIQAARVHFWEQKGLTQFHKEHNIGPTVAAINCQFKKPLHYPGTVTIQTRVEWVKNSSFQLKHHLLNEAGELAAEGEDVIVWFDYNRNEKVSISEEMKANILA